MIEVTEQVIAVRRQVGRRTLEAGEAHSVLISQDYDAPGRGRVGRVHQPAAHPPVVLCPSPGS